MNFARIAMARIGIALAMVAALGACSAAAPDGDTPEPVSGDETADEGEPVSILRPDVEAEQDPVEEAPLEPLNATIGFPNGGDEIDGAALAGLQEVLASEQIKLGGPIVLRAHSDSDGSDTANADAAEARGVAVAAWLIEQGIADDRIDIIVFGEQNPIEPNALPDGSPNEAGRALNRRVEVLIVPPREPAQAPQAQDEQSAETGDAG